MSAGGIPGRPEPTLRLALPDGGIQEGDLVLRLPRAEDIDALEPALRDPELREAGNLPDFDCSRRPAAAGSPPGSRAMLAEHAFALGVLRVEAYVNVGNDASDRVLERVGYTREGTVRSLPKPDGRRVDKALWSLLPGE